MNSMEIYNGQGKRIYYTAFFQPLVNLPEQPSGIYFLILNFNNNFIINKIVIEK